MWGQVTPHTSSGSSQCTVVSIFSLLPIPPSSALVPVPTTSFPTQTAYLGSSAQESQLSVSQVRLCLLPVKRETPCLVQWTARTFNTTSYHCALGQGADTPEKAEMVSKSRRQSSMCASCCSQQTQTLSSPAGISDICQWVLACGLQTPKSCRLLLGPWESGIIEW